MNSGSTSKQLKDLSYDNRLLLTVYCHISSQCCLTEEERIDAVTKVLRTGNCSLKKAKVIEKLNDLSEIIRRDDPKNEGIEGNI